MTPLLRTLTPLLPAILSLAVAACAANTPAPTTIGTTETTAATVEETRICDSNSRTGSRMRARTCMTPEERDELERQTRENVDRWQRDASLGGPKGN